MLMGWTKPGQLWSEASYVCFDGQVGLNNNINGLPVSGQETSVANKDEKTQVLGKPVFTSGDCYAFRPKATVCKLLPGQYLPCGLGRSDIRGALFNLTSVDIRRWELCASGISEILKTYNPADTVKVERLNEFLEERELDETFAIHIPNFSMGDIERDWVSNLDALPLKETGYLFLNLLRFYLPLTAAYGGIHLSAWNFEFPSRVESVIWRTACFIIMGSSFALQAIRSWMGLVAYNMDQCNYCDIFGMVWMTFSIVVGYGSAGLFLLCYVAARIYLVVESFISLRHVPIGVYAAVPWVQNIPHV